MATHNENLARAVGEVIALTAGPAHTVSTAVMEFVKNPVMALKSHQFLTPGVESKAKSCRADHGF